MIRRALAIVGVLLAVTGFVMLIDRGLAGRLSTSQQVLVPIGLLALLQAYRVARGRMKTDVEIAETDDPETEQDLTVPGEEFDDRLASLEGVSHFRLQGASGHAPRRDHVIRNRDRIRKQLEEAAVATISNKWGCPEAEAERALEEGTWTDDPHAAAYFTGDISEVGLRTRVINALSPEARYQRRARRAAEAIAELSAADADRIREEVTSG